MGRSNLSVAQSNEVVKKITSQPELQQMPNTYNLLNQKQLKLPTQKKLKKS